MARRWIASLWLMWTVLLVGQASRADVRIGFGTTLPANYPIDTFFSDSRFQFIIPREELRLESGEAISGLSLYLDSSAGHSIPQFTVRLRNAAQVHLDSMATGRFINGGLTLCRQSSLTVPSTPGWVFVTFTASHVMDASGDLLVDLVMNKSAAGSASNWSTVVATDLSLRHGVTNTNPSFNLLGQTTGTGYGRRPMVILDGAMRRMPALVANASQLADPDGRIHADWNVSGRRTTILPGVTLDFAAGYGLYVYHDLQAFGTETDSIRFTGTDWRGVYASIPSGRKVELSHCVIENSTQGGAALAIWGATGGLRNSIRHTSIRNGGTNTGLNLTGGLCDLDQVRIEDCNVGLYVFDEQGQMENLTLAGNDYGLVLDGLNWDETSWLRRLEVTGSSLYGVSTNSATVRLEHVTVRGNSGVGAGIGSGSTVEWVNSVLHNPTASHELQASGGSITALSHCALMGGLARCSQDATSLVATGVNVLTADPQLGADHRPLAGSPVIDAGNPLAGADPDLTPPDIGCHWFDQSAPVATAAVDVPQDQGGRLQLAWNPSSMDLAQANGSWFYSLWRLDTLFGAARAALPVVRTRALAEAAIAQGEPFLWERDGSAWHFLGSVPAAQHSQYAQVVETLADRLDGQPWPTPLKVLWHAGEVLSESAVITGTSVDNVPPDAPLLLAALEAPDGNLRLHWQPVTTGTVNGVQLPERNGVLYRVYEVPEAYAPENVGTLLGTTHEQEFTLPPPVGNERRFFRVRAEDNL